MLSEKVRELITRLDLEEDAESIIIPVPAADGRVKRCHLLKRPYIRIVYPDRHYADFPLEDVIEATVKFPDLLLSEALKMIYDERQTNEDATEDDAPAG